MTIIAVASQKGGTGKTTTTSSLATLLAKHARTLCVDCDPQGNLSQSFGLIPEDQTMTLNEVLMEECSIQVAAQSVGGFLSVVPANLRLASLWRRVDLVVGKESLLRDSLRKLRGYQYVLLDCPPSLDDTTVNALVAATDVIIPVDMSFYSMRGMALLMGTIEKIRTKANPKLKRVRILACRTDNTNVSKGIEESLRENYPGRMFTVAIPRSKDVPEAQASRVPLPSYAPRSRATVAYESLAKEILNGEA